MQIPALPATKNIDELHDYLVSLDLFLQNAFANGTQIDFATANDISGMSNLSQAGKIFYKSDESDPTKKFVGFVNNAGTLQSVTFTTS